MSWYSVLSTPLNEVSQAISIAWDINIESKRILPDRSSNAVGSVHTIAWLNFKALNFRVVLVARYAECFVEFRHIRKRSVSPENSRRVRVGVNQLSLVVRTDVLPPCLCPCNKEPLLWCKAIYHSFWMFFQVILKCSVSNGQSAKISSVLANGKFTFHVH